jgi:hypothetical protein
MENRLINEYGVFSGELAEDLQRVAREQEQRLIEYAEQHQLNPQEMLCMEQYLISALTCAGAFARISLALKRHQAKRAALATEKDSDG